MIRRKRIGEDCSSHRRLEDAGATDHTDLLRSCVDRNNARPSVWRGQRFRYHRGTGLPRRRVGYHGSMSAGQARAARGC
jgi:hypothetical protein